MLIYIACTMLVIASIVFAQVMIHREKRRIEQIKKGIDWQFEKMEKVANGWRPSLWDDDATEDEKYEAIMAYAEGRPLPVKQRPQLPDGGKRRK